MTHLSRSLTFDSFRQAESTINSLASAQGFRIHKVLGPFGTSYESQGIASFKCSNCAYFVTVRRLPEALTGSQEKWDIYTFNDEHSPVCLSRRRVRRGRSVSTVPSQRSSDVELSEDSDNGEYDEFGRPRREYVRSPSLPLPEPVSKHGKLGNGLETTSSSHQRDQPAGLPPITSEQSESSSVSSLVAAARLRSPTPDPTVLSSYLEDLIASLDHVPGPLDDSDIDGLTSEQVMAAVNEPLLGFQASEMDASDFLATLNQDQLQDLAPRLNRAVSVVQTLAPQDLLLQNVPSFQAPVPSNFGISPHMLHPAPQPSTSSVTMSSISAGLPSAVDVFKGNGNAHAVGSGPWDEDSDADEEEVDDDGPPVEKETIAMADYSQDGIPEDVLDRELARALQSPSQSPPPSPLRGLDPPIATHTSIGDADPDFDLYEIFPSYEAAEGAILNNARALGLPLNILWRPNPYVPSTTGARYECVRSCGYEIKLSDDAHGKWRVTSVEGAHERQCHPSYKGKRKAKSERRKPGSRPGDVTGPTVRQISPISSRPRRRRSDSRSASPSLTVVARSDTYIRTMRIDPEEQPLEMDALDSQVAYPSADIQSSPPDSHIGSQQTSPRRKQKAKNLYAQGDEYIYKQPQLQKVGTSPAKPIVLEADDDDDDLPHPNGSEGHTFGKARKTLPTRPAKRGRPPRRKSQGGPSATASRQMSGTQQAGRGSSVSLQNLADSPLTIKDELGMPVAFARKRLPTTYALRKATTPAMRAEDWDSGDEDEYQESNSRRRSVRKSLRRAPGPRRQSARRSTRAVPVEREPAADFGVFRSPARVTQANGSRVPRKSGTGRSSRKPTASMAAAGKVLPPHQLPGPHALQAKPSSVVAAKIRRLRRNMSLAEAGMTSAQCRVLKQGGYTFVRHLVREGLESNSYDFDQFQQKFGSKGPPPAHTLQKSAIIVEVKRIIFEIRVRSSIIYETNGEMAGPDDDSDEESEDPGTTTTATTTTDEEGPVLRSSDIAQSRRPSLTNGHLRPKNAIRRTGPLARGPAAATTANARDPIVLYTSSSSSSDENGGSADRAGAKQSGGNGGRVSRRPKFLKGTLQSDGYDDDDDDIVILPPRKQAAAAGKATDQPAKVANRHTAQEEPSDDEMDFDLPPPLTSLKADGRAVNATLHAGASEGDVTITPEMRDTTQGRYKDEARSKKRRRVDPRQEEEHSTTTETGSDSNADVEMMLLKS